MKDPDGHTPRILVVEDDHVMRDMVVDYLGDHNMRGLSASGSQEVAGIFAQSEPDLVVLDLRLDREDGLDLLREIRTRSDVPVVITTGDRRDEIDRVVGLELGRRRDARRRSGTRSGAGIGSETGNSIGEAGALPIPPAIRSH